MVYFPIFSWIFFLMVSDLHLETTISGSNPVTSYVMRWALCSSHLANVLVSVKRVGRSREELIVNVRERNPRYKKFTFLKYFRESF